MARSLKVVKVLPPQAPSEGPIIAYRLLEEDGTPVHAVPQAWCLCHAKYEGPEEKRPKKLAPSKPCYEVDGFVRLQAGQTLEDAKVALEERARALEAPAAQAPAFGDLEGATFGGAP